MTKTKTKQKRIRSTSQTQRDPMRGMVQVNLPASTDHYATGNGETVWAKLSPSSLATYKREVPGRATVELRSDSFFYSDIRVGNFIEVDLRPHKKPVAIYDGQFSNLALNPRVSLFLSLGAMPWFPQSFFPQLRRFTEAEHRTHLSGGDTLEFTDAFYPPGLTAHQRRQHVAQARHNCAHSPHNH